MAKKLIFLLFICAAISALIAAVCVLQNEPPPNTVSAEDAIRQYNIASSIVNEMQDLTYTVSHTKEISIGNASLSESSEQILRYSDLGSSRLAGETAETLVIGDQAIEITELYRDGMAYITVNGSAFCNELTPAEYQNRYIPAVMIDPGNYKEITAGSNADILTIRFMQSQVTEAWLQSPSESLSHADATVRLDLQGRLLQSQYHAVMTCNGIKITHNISVTIKYDDKTPPSLPAAPDTYMPIDYLDGPRQLEVANAYLLASNRITSTYQSFMSFDGFGDIREETVTVHIEENPGWTAQLKTEVTLSNTGRSGDITHMVKKENFTNGVYMLSIDGAADIKDPNIDRQTMQTWCNDILSGTIMLPQHITHAIISESNEILRISFQGTQEFMDLVWESSFQTFYNTTIILGDLPTSQPEGKLEAYLDLDKYTGLPVAAGITYSGAYTFDGITYTLNTQCSQVYQIGINK